MIVPRVFKSRQRKRKNISIVLSSQANSQSYDWEFAFIRISAKSNTAYRNDIILISLGSFSYE